MINSSNFLKKIFIRLVNPVVCHLRVSSCKPVEQVYKSFVICQLIDISGCNQTSFDFA